MDDTKRRSLQPTEEKPATLRSNHAVPPPVPPAALNHRPLARPSIAVHNGVANRDNPARPATHIEPHVLTIPPSPPVPRVRGWFDWKLFLGVVLASSVSTASALGSAYYARTRSAAQTASERISVITITPKPRAPSPHSLAPVAFTTPTPQPAAQPATSSERRTTHVVARRTVRANDSSPAPVASAHVAAPSHDALVPEVPLLGAVDMAQQHTRGAILMCGIGVPNATSFVRATVAYSNDGSVSHVDLSPPWSGTAPGRCMENAIRTRALLPRFAAQTYSANFVFPAR